MTACRDGADGAPLKKKRRKIPRHVEEKLYRDPSEFKFFALPSNPPVVGSLFRDRSEPEPAAPAPPEDLEWA